MNDRVEFIDEMKFKKFINEFEKKTNNNGTSSGWLETEPNTKTLKSVESHLES